MSFSINNPLYKDDLQRILTTVGADGFKGKSFLITGATGMIGSCLIDTLMLLDSYGVDIKVYAVGRNLEKASVRFSYCKGNPSFSFIQQDVRDPLPEDLTVDYVIPLASNTHPLAYSQFPIETIFINVDGARHSFDLATKCGATVIYPSSVEIYGNARDTRSFKEDDTGVLDLSKARSCYTESKRLCEAMCQSYISERDVDARIVRLSRVFGPTMLMEDSKASSQFIKKALAKEDIVLKSNGEQLFSYTYVIDAVSAIMTIMLCGKKGEAYNVASEQLDVHLKDFASACAKYAGTKVIFDLPSESERKGYSVATTAIMDGSKLRNCGWEPMYSFNEAIRRTLDMLKN